MSTVSSSFFARLLQFLFARKDVNSSANSVKPRRIVMERLEDRQLLSVSPLLPGNMAAFYSAAENNSFSAVDTTTASLANALPSSSGALSQQTQSNGSCLYQWVQVGLKGGNFNDEVCEDYEYGLSTERTELFLFQSNNGTASLHARAWWSYEFDLSFFCQAGYSYDSHKFWASANEDSDYWTTNEYISYDELSLTWQKPADIANDEVQRDFTFTFYVYHDVNNNNIMDPGEEYGSVTPSLNVHIAWAEVQVQFAGEGDYQYTTATTTTSIKDAGNTVIVGQKISAVINADPRLTINSYQWQAFDDRIKNYVTTNDNGQVVNLTASDRAASNFNYYHIDTSQPSTRIASAECSLSVSYTPAGGIEKTQSLSATPSTYFVDKPTVTSFTSVFANWPGTSEPATGIRPFETGQPNRLILGGTPVGQSFSPGIKWTANVTAPPLGGGQIAYNQQVSGSYQRYINGDSNPKEKAAYTNGTTMLDTTFPYPYTTIPVGNTLISEDSPLISINRTVSSTHPYSYSQPFNKYTADFSFNTYLIYRPDGDDSIWVTISVINWGWNAEAVYNNTTNKWEATGSTSGGGNGTATSSLPQWTDNAASHAKWVPLI